MILFPTMASTHTRNQHKVSQNNNPNYQSLNVETTTKSDTPKKALTLLLTKLRTALLYGPQLKCNILAPLSPKDCVSFGVP